MTFFLDYAAHVENDVVHTSSVMRETLGISAAAIGVVISFVVTEGGISAVMFAAMTDAVRFGAAAADLGSILDSVGPKSSEGKIVAGFKEVLLGPKILPAARASAPETKLSCHSDPIAEGSKTVVIGSDFKPMVRRNDRTGCGGVISTGLLSLMVGGEPSAAGVQIDEKDSDTVRLMNVAFGLGSTARSFARGQMLSGLFKGSAALATEQGDKKSAAVLKGAGALTSVPGNTFDAGMAARSVQKGASTLLGH